jgi:ABC-type Fe3+ transport system permease subunit
MRLSNAWQKFRNAALCACAVAIALFCVYQLFSAVAYGAVIAFGRRHDWAWITFDSHPISYVFSLSLYGLIGAAVVGVLCVVLFEPASRWRTRQDIDESIRLDVNSR